MKAEERARLAWTRQYLGEKAAKRLMEYYQVGDGKPELTELVDLSLDADPPGTDADASEDSVLDWYKRTRPTRHLRVLRATEQARWQRSRNGNGK